MIYKKFGFIFILYEIVNLTNFSEILYSGALEVV